jgi:hypothetical protein
LVNSKSRSDKKKINEILPKLKPFVLQMTSYKKEKPSVEWEKVFTTLVSDAGFFYLCISGVCTQDFLLSRQVLYCLSHTSGLFCSGYF